MHEVTNFMQKPVKYTIDSKQIRSFKLIYSFQNDIYYMYLDIRAYIEYLAYYIIVAYIVKIQSTCKVNNRIVAIIEDNYSKTHYM